jgi:hypothetical protein
MIRGGLSIPAPSVKICCGYHVINIILVLRDSMIFAFDSLACSSFYGILSQQYVKSIGFFKSRSCIYYNLQIPPSHLLLYHFAYSYTYVQYLLYVGSKWVLSERSNCVLREDLYWYIKDLL